MATMAQAIRLALHYGEENLGVTDIFGEDVGPPLGGVFTCTQGLRKSYNSPLDERGIIGAAIGIAQAGGIPVAEIQFADYIFNTVDLLKIAGNHCWASNGEYPLNITVMTPCSAGIHGSIYHSHSFESIAAHLQGWKIVMPSNPKDAYAMMLSCIKDPNPCLYLYPKALLRVRGKELIPGEPENAAELKKAIDMPLTDRDTWKPMWPPVEDYSIPFGKAKKVTDGDHLTVVTYGREVDMVLKASADLKGVEIIDLRSLLPWDEEMVFESVRKTGRLMIVSEDTEVVSFAEHILRRVVECCFYDLKVKPRIIGALNLPCGLAHNLENFIIPTVGKIKTNLSELSREEA